MLPSGSDDAEASAVTASGSVPDEGVTVSLATGGWFPAGDTVTVAEAVAIAPPLSVTGTLAVHVPAASLDAAAPAVTASGSVPDDGVTVSLATGGWFPAGDTVTVAEAVAVA